MIESNLLGGAQDYRQRPLVYGRSVTDPCLSLEKTSLCSPTSRRRSGRSGRDHDHGGKAIGSRESGWW